MNLFDIRKELEIGIPLTEMNLRVTRYARVSTDHEEQLTSLKNQVDYFDEMIKNNSKWTYVEGYVDEGISGVVDYKREEFMRMINDAHDDKFDLIITKEISRFSRNTLDSIKYTRELLNCGVAVWFLNDNINTALLDSELRLTIMASMAQDEIRRLSQRVKFGMNRAIKNGHILGSDTLYGYKKNKLTNNLVIIDKESEIVERIYKMYVNNISINKIADILNNEEIRTNKGNTWSASTIMRMIKNPKYKGYYCGKKTETLDYMKKKIKYIDEDKWISYKDFERIPPIVSEKLWNLANDKMMKRKRKSSDKSKYLNRYPLSGKIYCKEHNDVFYRRKQCRCNNDITWLSSNYLKKGKKCCNSPNIRESELFKILADVLELSKEEKNRIKEMLLTIYSKYQKNGKKVESDLNIQKSKIVKKRQKLIDLYIDKIISKEEIKLEINKLDKELEQLNEIKIKGQAINSDIKTSIEEIFLRKEFLDILIKLSVNKIIASKKDNTIILEILLNSKVIPFERSYSFKRGYDNNKTKRYEVTYNVKIASDLSCQLLK